MLLIRKLFDNLSFFNKNLLFSILCILTVGVAITTSSYYIQGKVLKDTILQQLNGIIYSSFDKIQPSSVKNAINNPRLDSMEQVALMSVLDEIKKNPNVAQAYILGTEIKDGNKIRFISLSKNVFEMGAIPGYYYEQPDQVLRAITKLKITKTTTFTDIYSDIFGTWATVMRPILDENGNVFAYFAIDIDASKIIEAQRDLLQWSSLALLLLLIFMISIQYRALRKILFPFQELHRAINEVSSGKLDVFIDVERSDDIGKLIANFNIMTSSLRDIITEIQAKNQNHSNSFYSSDSSPSSISKLADDAKTILLTNEKYFQIMKQENKALAQYAENVELMAQIEERNRIAQDLHDTIGHTFTSLIMGLDILYQSIDKNEEVLLERLEKLLSLARTGFTQIRKNIHDISLENDATLSEEINSIINQFKEVTQIDISLAMIGKEYEVFSEIQMVLIRCLQESLTNAVRHGKATNINVFLQFESEFISLRVEDNGIGTDDIIVGFGLQTMKNRVENLQGQVSLQTEVGKGLTLVCKIPIVVKQAQNKIRVLLVDDQELILESLQILLMMESDFEVIGKANSGKIGIELCEQLQPDVVIIDVNMPGMDGVECTKVIKHRHPNVKVIILTTFLEVNHAIEGLDAGAEGYILKSIHPRQLVDGIRLVNNGGTLISQITAQSLVKQMKTIEPSKDIKTIASKDIDCKQIDKLELTKKELIVLKYLAEGFTYQEIADNLNLSKGTIKNYISNIYSKMNVNNRTQALKKYQELSTS